MFNLKKKIQVYKHNSRLKTSSNLNNFLFFLNLKKKINKINSLNFNIFFFYLFFFRKNVKNYSSNLNLYFSFSDYFFSPQNLSGVNKGSR